MQLHQINANLAGLTTEQVVESRSKHGENKIQKQNDNYLWTAIKGALKEPMLLLLAAASVLYFFHGDVAEGVFLLAAIILVVSIARYQESRSKNALEALKKL